MVQQKGYLGSCSLRFPGSGIYQICVLTTSTCTGFLNLFCEEITHFSSQSETYFFHEIFKVKTYQDSASQIQLGAYTLLKLKWLRLLDASPKIKQKLRNLVTIELCLGLSFFWLDTNTYLIRSSK